MNRNDEKNQKYNKSKKQYLKMHIDKESIQDNNRDFSKKLKSRN